LTNQNRQENTWKLLKSLHPQPIDLSRVELIRKANVEFLAQPDNLIDLLPSLGLNDEGIDEFPKALHDDCGHGLRIWQYPIQFAPYIAFLATLKVRSYLELGIRHGGSYIATVELLERFHALEFAIGVDIIPCPAMTTYQSINPRSRFVCINSQSPEFLTLIENLPSLDLVFIDSHHEENQCRREFAMLSQVAQMVALHDIFNIGCVGIATVWQEIKALPDWTCFEFTDQYSGLDSFMGIGLAVKNSRLAEETVCEQL
jgi:hypothetical protein